MSVVLADGLWDHDHALALELPGDRAWLGHRTAVAREQRTHFRAGAVAVVGQALHDQRDSRRGVALVGDGFITDPVELPGAALYGALDRVEGDRGVPGLGEHRAQRGVGGEVAATFARRYLHLADQFREELATGLVDGALAMLGGCPLRMA